MPIISPEHLKALAASCITPEFAALRGYETAENITCLQALGLAKKAQVLVPGLMFPLRGSDGLVITRGKREFWQYRPDNPRMRDGKPVKYEMPWRQPNVIDVPPGVGGWLLDPTVDLWITEGTKKADCGAVHGLCIVAINGVWGYLSKGVALPDWRDVQLQNRRVILAFDSDVSKNPQVLKALRDFAAWLLYKGAHVEYLHLPDDPAVKKVGLDDFLAAGHTTADLYALVNSTQPAQQQAAPAPKPPPAAFGSIDGAALLDDVATYLADYVVYPQAWARVAHTLWIAHTHLMDCWESTPRIGFLSPEPGSGKTRALEVTEPLVPRPVHAVNATPAYLFRKVSDPAGPPTVLYDEIDTVFGPRAKENEEVRGMLNAGHRKGAVAGRATKKGDAIVTEELPAYCAVAMAGLDDLPDTVMTRSVVVRMKPRDRTETIKPWRLRIDMPIGVKLGERIEEWAASVRAHIAYPQIPAGVEDRNADVWEALLSVADAAGGHWPQTARVAAVEAVEALRGRALTMGVLLLSDVRQVFEDASAKDDDSYLFTNSLLLALCNLDESPWSTIKRNGKSLDARGLAQRLARYGISSSDIKDKATGMGLKGFYRRQFNDAWTRYLTPIAQVSNTPPTRDSRVSSTASTPGARPLNASTASTASTDAAAAASLKVRDFFSGMPYSEPEADPMTRLFGAKQPPGGTPPPPANGRPALCSGCHQKLANREQITRGVCFECHTKGVTT